MNRVFCTIVLALGMVALGVGLQTANADLLIQHQGKTDPTTEGWTATVGGTGGTSQGITDAVGPTDAWQISNGTGDYTQFRSSFSAGDLLKANTNGWSYKITARMPTAADAADWSPAVGFDNGVRDYNLLLGSDASGNAIASLWDGGSYTLTSGGYHTYEFRGAAGVTGSMDFYIDGVLKEAAHDGIATGEPYTLVWGGGYSPGDANFASVEFDIVPEPNSVILLTTALIGLLAYAWRRRK